MTPIRPKFENPPLVERAVSVAFSKLDGFSIGDYGLFWSRIRDQFPISESKMPVMQAIEAFDGFKPTRQEIQLLAEDALPRAFFRNPQLGELVQVQPDRFGFNWLKASKDDRYPHSEVVLERFFTLLALFQDFLRSRGLGEIQPTQCELTNVNIIAVEDVGENFADVSTVVRFPELDGSFDFLRLESQTVGAKLLILGDDNKPIGRVHSLGQPSLQVETQELAFRLDITARGAPLGAGIAGVEKFFEHAVSAVNAVFLASVTQSGRQFWGEQNG